MLRRAGHSAVASFVAVAFFVQNTGAADVAFLAARHGPAGGPSAAWLPLGALKAAPGPRVVLPAEPWLSRAGSWMLPRVTGLARWLDDLSAFPEAAPEPVQIASSSDSEAAPAEPAFPSPAPGLPMSAALAPPAPDRMLVDARGFDFVAFGEGLRWARAGRPVVHEVAAPRIEGPWKEQNGLRFRLTYLKPEGFITLDKDGALVREGTGPGRRMSASRRIPERIFGRYAVYHEGDLVDYEIELMNVSGARLSGLEVFTGQEVMDPEGGTGRLLGDVGSFEPVSLAAEGRAVLKGKLRVAGAAVARSNFEQTHLTVYRPGEKGDSRRLVDEPQAGIIDPP